MLTIRQREQDRRHSLQRIEPLRTPDMGSSGEYQVLGGQETLNKGVKSDIDSSAASVQNTFERGDLDTFADIMNVRWEKAKIKRDKQSA